MALQTAHREIVTEDSCPRIPTAPRSRAIAPSTIHFKGGDRVRISRETKKRLFGTYSLLSPLGNKALNVFGGHKGLHSISQIVPRCHP